MELLIYAEIQLEQVFLFCDYFFFNNYFATELHIFWNTVGMMKKAIKTS
jgi:hypothetical protein